MCNKSCIDFGESNIRKEHIYGKSVIEVGSHNINGSLRSIVESFEPNNYVGVDITMGPGVDQICKAEDLIDKYGINKFDVLISTELLEHVLNWKRCIHNFKQIIKPGGILLVTTRSIGFNYHGYPYDFWRYEISDMEIIFEDFNIELLEKDPLGAGVFLIARKPLSFIETKMTNHKLFSILSKKKSSILLNFIYGSIRRLFKSGKYFILHPTGIPAMIRRKLNRSNNC